MSKPTLATVSLGGCEGCHVSLLDAHEGLLALLDTADLVYSPFSGPSEIPAHVDVVMVEGAVTTDEDLRRLRAARAAGDTLVAVGSCAVLGGIGGLRNLSRLSDVTATAFGAGAKKSELLPTLERHVHAITDFVEADIIVPGCAPQTAISLTQWLTKSCPMVSCRSIRKATFNFVPTPSTLETRIGCLSCRVLRANKPPNPPTFPITSRRCVDASS